METVDVAIAGGGPGGLAAAAALHAVFDGQVKVKVYESLQEYKVQGSGVLFNANGQSAVEAINPDLLQRFKAHSVWPGTAIQYDPRGKEVRRISAMSQASLAEQYGKGPFFLGWHEIRQLIYESVPSGVVEFGSQVASYEEDKEGVIVHFDGGQPSVKAKVLIGADGYFSRIRKQCLNDGPPLFAGLVMWRARIAWQEGMPEHSVTYREEGPMHLAPQAAILFPLGTLESTSETSWSWTLIAQPQVVKQAGVEFDPEARTLTSVQGVASSGSALQNVLKVFEGFPPAIMDVVSSTDPSTVTQHGLYMRPLDKITPEEGWGKGRVSLLGDAAHATIPNGQGACLVIEDAVVLAWHLKQHGFTAEALRSFEFEQVTRAKDVIAHGHDTASLEDKEKYLYKPKFRQLWQHEEMAALNGNGTGTGKVPQQSKRCITMRLAESGPGRRAVSSGASARSPRPQSTACRLGKAPLLLRAGSKQLSLSVSHQCMQSRSPFFCS